MRILGQFTLALFLAAAVLASCEGNVSTPLGIHQDALPAGRTSAHRGPSSYEVMHRFGGIKSARDPGGANPAAGLVYVNGTLYGTATNGGRGHGVVYSIGSSSKQIVLYRFRGHKAGDGSTPNSDLLYMNGTLYGTTAYGGTCGGGTVYSVSTTGAEKVLHSFCGGQYDPTGGVIDVNGTLYGTFAAELTGGGVYSLTTSGAYTLLHAFTSVTDGYSPVGRLLDVNGTLYGTTTYGATYCAVVGSAGCGTVYSITTSGNEKVLYSFQGGADGYFPVSGLIDVNGTLYGTTLEGGNSGCKCGTIYSITTDGTENVLYRFAGGSDGSSPQASLLELNGLLYGTTARGGSYDDGTIFSFDTSGGEQVLHSFGAARDGRVPVADLTDVNGSMYGTTYRGGSQRKCAGTTIVGCGTVYAFRP